jgi:hypothetical protein
MTLLDVHPSRRHDLMRPDEMRATALRDPSVEIAVSHTGEAGDCLGMEVTVDVRTEAAEPLHLPGSRAVARAG